MLWIDTEQLREFVDLLTDGNASSVLSFQTYGDKDHSVPTTGFNCLAGELDSVVPQLNAIQQRGGAITLAVNELDDVASPRRSEHMVARRCLCVDVDAKDTDVDVARVVTLALRPHFIVHSGGGFHAYWLLDNSTPWDSLEWLGLQAALAQRVNSDTCTVNQALVLRAAGTWHQKRDPILCTLERVGSHPRLTHADVQAMGLEPLVAQEAQVLHFPLDVTPAPAGVVNRVLRTVMASSWPSAIEGQGGDATLWSVAVLCAQNGLNEQQTMDVLTEYNASKSRPPFTVQQVKHKATRARLWRLGPQCPTRAKALDVIRLVQDMTALDRDDVTADEMNAAHRQLAAALAAGGWDPASVCQIALQAQGIADDVATQGEFRTILEGFIAQLPTVEPTPDADDDTAVFTAWKAGVSLDTNKDGIEQPSDFNLGQYLEHAPVLRAVQVDRCSGDFRVGSTVIPCGTVPRWVMNMVRLHMGGPSFRIAQVRAGLESFDFPVFCPVADWLTSLTWDGVDRIPELVRRGFAVDPSPLNLAKFTVNLVGAVRRALEPSCKHDTVLTLMGAGGLRKSSALAELFGRNWFVDNGVDPSAEGESAHRTNAVTLSTVWAAELAELVAVRKGDTERVKAYLTTATDKVRTLFTQSTQSIPRRSVFVATFNPDNSPTFTDEALARRFHIVHVSGRCDTAFIAKNRSQIWAQVTHLFHSDTPNWLDEAFQEQERQFMRSLFVSSPVDELLADKLRKAMGSRPFLPCSELATMLQLDPLASNSGANTRKVATAARLLGWTQGHKRLNGVNTRVWLRPPTVSADVTDELDGAHVH